MSSCMRRLKVLWQPKSIWFRTAKANSGRFGTRPGQIKTIRLSRFSLLACFGLFHYRKKGKRKRAYFVCKEKK